MRKRLIGIGRGVIHKEPNYVFYWLNFLRGLGFGFIGPVYALFLFSQGLNPLQVNIINVFFSLTNLTLTIPAGALADSWGRKKTFLLSSVFNSLSFFIYALAKKWPAFIAGEITSGIGYVLMMGVLEAWVVDAWKNKTGGSEYSFLFSRGDTSNYLAAIIGGLLGGLIGTISLRLPFMLGSIVFLLILGVSYFLMEKDPYQGEVKLKLIFTKSTKIIKEGIKESLTNKAILYVSLYGGIIMFGLKALDMFWSKRFVDLAQGKIGVTAYIWVLMTLFMVIGTLVLKRWTDEKRNYLTIFIKIGFFISLMVFLSSIFQNYYLALTPFLIYEIGRGMFRPGLFGYLNQIIESRKRATVLSFTICIAFLGNILGLLSLGWIAKNFSIEASWMTASLVIILSLIPIFKLKKI